MLAEYKIDIIAINWMHDDALIRHWLISIIIIGEWSETITLTFQNTFKYFVHLATAMAIHCTSHTRCYKGLDGYQLKKFHLLGERCNKINFSMMCTLENSPLQVMEYLSGNDHRDESHLWSSDWVGLIAPGA